MDSSYINQAILGSSIIYFLILVVGYFFKAHPYKELIELRSLRLIIVLFVGLCVMIPHYSGNYTLQLFSLILFGFIVVYIPKTYVFLALIFIWGFDAILFHNDIEFFTSLIICYFTLALISKSKFSTVYKNGCIGITVLLFMNIEMLAIEYTSEQILISNIFGVINFFIIMNLFNFLMNYNEIYTITKRLATVDTDTELYNRMYFNRLYLGKEINYSMGIVDIDLFKNYESLYGYNITNQIVRKLGNTMSYNLSGIGHIYRYNHDRFYVMITSTDTQKVVRSFNRLKAEVENSEIVIDTHTIKYTVSIGIKLNENLVQCDALINETNNALRESKILGRNKITVA